MPTQPLDTPLDAAELTSARDGEQPAPRMPAALLLCRNAEAKRWGPRWLGRAGFETERAAGAAEALALFEQHRPAVVIIDASLKDAELGWALEAVQRKIFDSGVPILALCRGDREVQRALDSHVDAIVRHPVDWRLELYRIGVARRARDERSELGRLRDRLNQALEILEEVHEKSEQAVERDRLTDLPSRATFASLIERTLVAGDDTTTVVVLAIDRFDAVNEALGRAGGDRVLAQTAQRLREVLAEREWLPENAGGLATAALARLSGVHFGIVTTHGGGADGASRLAHQLLRSLSHPIDVDGQRIYVTGSAGAALVPTDGETADQLMLHSETALEEARHLGGGILRFYRASLNEGTKRKLSIDRALRRALREDQLRVYYQPLVDFASGEITGAEALLRWQHPEHGMIPPLEFIPVAEETGLMADIGYWTLDVACRQLAAWDREGFTELKMAVNLSLSQFRRGDLVFRVRAALRENGLHPSRLELEISERGVLSGDDEVLEILLELKALGVHLALDDFGMGDSSITYLKDFPVDSLKIDKSFVGGALDNESDSAITSAMVAIGQRLSLKIVAEGVETDNQLELLKAMGCHQFQGFLFSPAVPGEEFHLLLSGPREVAQTLPFAPRRVR